jgi:broad specificity phosphatase PhoE
MRLLLIRHAQSTDNVVGILGTELPGPDLTDLGREQAAAIPAALSDESIDAIYVSTMQRTGMTAVPLAERLGLRAQVIDGIQEIGAGEFEGRSDRDAIHGYMGTIISWWQTSAARIPGAESGDEFFTRFTGAINGAVRGHDTVAVFSHGASIRTWASAISRNIDEAFSRTHDLPNTAMIVLEGSPEDGWVATHWDGEPVGGAELDDPLAVDPTGDAD